jgi:uncharacterized protein YcfJ
MANIKISDLHSADCETFFDAELSPEEAAAVNGGGWWGALTGALTGGGTGFLFGGPWGAVAGALAGGIAGHAIEEGTTDGAPANEYYIPY